MATCNIVGKLINGSGEEVDGIFVHAVCADSPAIIQNTSTGIIPENIRELTTSTGIFELTLVRNVNYIVHIPEMGFKKTILVPDEAGPVNLWGLTDILVSGDPTPTDTGDDW